MVSDNSRGEAVYLLKSIYYWFICAFLMVLLFSLLICKTSLDSSYIGYISSFISFFAAACSGVCSSRYIRSSEIVFGLISSGFIVIVLLTIGFLIAGNDMSPSGIISVSSFTVAGVMLGVCTRKILYHKNKNRLKQVKLSRR